MKARSTIKLGGNRYAAGDSIPKEELSKLSASQRKAIEHHLLDDDADMPQRRQPAFTGDDLQGRIRSTQQSTGSDDEGPTAGDGSGVPAFVEALDEQVRLESEAGRGGAIDPADSPAPRSREFVPREGNQGNEGEDATNAAARRVAATGGAAGGARRGGPAPAAASGVNAGANSRGGSGTGESRRG